MLLSKIVKSGEGLVFLKKMNEQQHKELKVVSDFEPAGSQPEAIDNLVSGLEDGLLHQTLLGVTGSGKTYTMAKVIEETQRPAIIMAHNKTLAAQLYGCLLYTSDAADE